MGTQMSAVLVVLMLAVGGCAMTEEIAPPPERAAAPVQMAQTVEPVAKLPEASESEPVVDPEWAGESEPEEVRAPLKEVLLEELAAAPKRPKYIVKSGDTLGTIADRQRVTLPMLQGVNHLKSNRIRAGQKLIIPEVPLRIEIDKSENKLRLFNGPRLARTYPVATGDQGVTPVGSYTIANRLIGPTWYWEGRAYPKDDPEYPLGSRWMGLSRRGYGIHGTNEPELIGQQVSHGCIRMLNPDVEELFDVAAIGTPVSIVE
jgi:lipoprotein-anchoring transpeptidase ErfK/SrfK